MDPGEEGFKFKIHIFEISEDEEIVKEQEKSVFMQLTDMFCCNIHSKIIPPKIRFFCSVKEKADAKNLYLNLHKAIEQPLRCSIFLDFPEEVFVKYADIEAKRYEDYIAEKERKFAEANQQRPPRDYKEGQGFREEHKYSNYGR